MLQAFTLHGNYVELLISVCTSFPPKLCLLCGCKLAYTGLSCAHGFKLAAGRSCLPPAPAIYTPPPIFNVPARGVHLWAPASFLERNEGAHRPPAAHLRIPTRSRPDFWAEASVIETHGGDGLGPGPLGAKCLHRFVKSIPQVKILTIILVGSKSSKFSSESSKLSRDYDALKSECSRVQLLKPELNIGVVAREHG